MVDRVNKEIRHRIMSANLGKNTSPEIEIRRALFRRGFRYRIHDTRLPGRPDIVLKKYRVAVFVHGCFWHGHECHRSPKSKSNRHFWNSKIARNNSRDLNARNALLKMGWRVLVIWECAVRRRSPPFDQSRDLNTVADWIKSSGRLAVLSEVGFEERL
jgi:DNA mismatch endonuclease (patch repair protein)